VTSVFIIPQETVVLKIKHFRISNGNTDTVVILLSCICKMPYAISTGWPWPARLGLLSFFIVC